MDLTVPRLYLLLYNLYLAQKYKTQSSKMLMIESTLRRIEVGTFWLHNDTIDHTKSHNLTNPTTFLANFIFYPSLLILLGISLWINQPNPLPFTFVTLKNWKTHSLAELNGVPSCCMYFPYDFYFIFSRFSHHIFMFIWYLLRCQITFYPFGQSKWM